jgi:hypothetical protein
MKAIRTAWLAMPLFLFACKNDTDINTQTPRDPNTAAKVSVDRFSATAGHLMVRTPANGLPGANVAVNFDQAPFITRGIGPGGQNVEYYNFDVQPLDPIPIYVFFKNGQSNPVSGQLNVINAVPGDAAYNDFWQVVKVIVPDDYVANTVTSFDEISRRGFSQQPTNIIVNCPVVPEGSTATKRLGGGSSAVTRGWYKDRVVFYFDFSERALTATAGGKVPVSPIYVCFNINPSDPNGGPASGFKTETGSNKTHNVVATIPSDAGYSPLWNVNAYNNTAFNVVNNLSTAQSAPAAGNNLATVNCPVVVVN